MSNPRVFVAVYEHRLGEDLRAFASNSNALAWQTKLALKWWDHEFPGEPKPDECDIGEAYFSKMRDLDRPEYFNIHMLDVEPD